MTKPNSKTVSPFAKAALALDEDFAQLDTIARQMDGIIIKSDHGLDHAKKLLLKFGECGQRVGDGIQALAKSLQDARIAAEAAAGKVAEQAAQVQKRHDETTELQTRFRNVGEMVRKISEAVAQLRRPNGTKLSNEERIFLSDRLPELTANLGVLLDEATKIREEAREMNMKMLEREAHALGQTLTSVRNKLSAFSPDRINSKPSRPTDVGLSH